MKRNNTLLSFFLAVFMVLCFSSFACADESNGTTATAAEPLHSTTSISNGAVISTYTYDGYTMETISPINMNNCFSRVELEQLSNTNSSLQKQIPAVSAKAVSSEWVYKDQIFDIAYSEYLSRVFVRCKMDYYRVRGASFGQGVGMFGASGYIRGGIDDAMATSIELTETYEFTGPTISITYPPSAGFSLWNYTVQWEPNRVENSQMATAYREKDVYASTILNGTVYMAVSSTAGIEYQGSIYSAVYDELVNSKP